MSGLSRQLLPVFFLSLLSGCGTDTDSYELKLRKQKPAISHDTSEKKPKRVQKQAAPKRPLVLNKLQPQPIPDLKNADKQPVNTSPAQALEAGKPSKTFLARFRKMMKKVFSPLRLRKQPRPAKGKQHWASSQRVKSPMRLRGGEGNPEEQGPKRQGQRLDNTGLNVKDNDKDVDLSKKTVKHKVGGKNGAHIDTAHITAFNVQGNAGSTNMTGARGIIIVENTKTLNTASEELKITGKGPVTVNYSLEKRLALKEMTKVYTQTLASENLGARVSAVAALDQLASGPLHKTLVDMLQKGQEKDKQDAYGATALIIAADEGYTAITKALLEAGADKNLKNKQGWTALMFAACNGHTDALAALIKSGADLDSQTIADFSMLGMPTKDQTGMTALMIAACNGHTDAVKALLKARADKDKQSTYGMTALMFAAHNGHTAAFKALLEARVDPDLQTTTDPNMAGMQWAFQNKAGMTALMFAADKGHTAAIKALLEVGADKDKQNEDGHTALMIVAQNGHTDAVKALLKAGADKDLKTKKRSTTALMLAAATGHTAAVRALLEAGAGKDIKNKHSSTALLLAAEYGRTAAVKALLEVRANKDIQDNDGDTALICAAEKGHTEAVKALLEAGANKGIKNKKGSTALMIAKSRRHKAIVLLLEKD